MGMQIHFRRDDLPTEATVTNDATEDGDSWHCDYAGKRLHAWSNDGKSFWFDCGSRTANQMACITLLIEWRVSFIAS